MTFYKSTVMTDERSRFATSSSLYLHEAKLKW